MRKLLAISLILLFQLACESNKPGKDLIPPETLVPVLIDLQLAYSIQSTQTFRTLSRRVDSIDTYSYVFEKYDVTKAMFDSTISWYSQHPDQFMVIYDEVVMEISQLYDSLVVGWEE